MLLALNIVPTLILVTVLYVRSKTFKTDLQNLNSLSVNQVLYSFCISIIGFSLLLKVSVQFIPSMAVTSTITKTPIMYIYAVLFSPVVEELLFRKYLLLKLNNYLNWWIAALISSTIFASLHFDSGGFIGYIFIGIVWCYYYRKSNNILVPIFSHFIFNYLAILSQSLKG